MICAYNKNPPSLFMLGVARGGIVIGSSFFWLGVDTVLCRHMTARTRDGMCNLTVEDANS